MEKLKMNPSPASSRRTRSPLTAPFSPNAGTRMPLASGARQLELPSPWRLQFGGGLLSAQLAYELTGPADGPLVVVLGGISSGRHVTSTFSDPRRGWWQPLVGPDRDLDTDRFRVLGIDFLGGNGASTGPADTEDGQVFPPVATSDQARALAALLDVLGVEHVYGFVGSSYGGMVALAFAALYPRRIEKLLVISAADRPHPRATAWRSLQRRIVRLAARQGDEHTGLALSRGLAMTTYRTPGELAQRFDGRPRRTSKGFRFPVEDYLEARGDAFAEVFDTRAFLCLSESLDLHRVQPERIEVDTTLVAVRSDELVPVEQLRDLYDRLPGNRRLVEIESLYGHDAFLKETDIIGRLLRESLGGV